MDTKNLLVSAVVALALSGLVVSLVPSSTQTLVKEVPVDLGAAATPDFNSTYVSWGGVRNHARGTSLNGDAASTTICALQAPQVASSSAVFFGLRLGVGTTTASTVKVYKSASKWVATTEIAGANFAAGEAKAIVATSTFLDSSNAVLSPNDWIVVRQTPQGGGAGTFSPTGSCGAQFVQI